MGFQKAHGERSRMSLVKSRMTVISLGRTLSLLLTERGQTKEETTEVHGLSDLSGKYPTICVFLNTSTKGA